MDKQLLSKWYSCTVLGIAVAVCFCIKVLADRVLIE